MKNYITAEGKKTDNLKKLESDNQDLLCYDIDLYDKVKIANSNLTNKGIIILSNKLICNFIYKNLIRAEQ